VTATGQRILVPTSVDRGVSCGQLGGTRTAVNHSFLDRSRYFCFKYLFIYAHETEWTPFQTPRYSENLLAPGIELGTTGSAAMNSDHETIETVSFPGMAEEKKTSSTWQVTRLKCYVIASSVRAIHVTPYIGPLHIEPVTKRTCR
jgi:hypothetical protein